MQYLLLPATQTRTKIDSCPDPSDILLRAFFFSPILALSLNGSVLKINMFMCTPLSLTQPFLSFYNSFGFLNEIDGCLFGSS
ncbi:unnamed protein product [Macrosiphum euphorbiae]|uniref:Uncharacterized protein n=1 Tax=Macrosiphum euphorbiae TaxID=13131 RepID=A0AAV0WD11_9HEMI|nr:unnamed protein product [Macrosiphum euphorbiae]